ncbi:MAG: GxxExxY protein [Candidatus Omnitrophica bacterium]|nr:GxxExxY protein [Candidatus Omnitrophota bacterium]
MDVEKLLYKKESYVIRGACFDIYKKFGGAFKESVIHKALVTELKHQGLRMENQKRIEITHRGVKVGVYIPDIVVDERILIELKSKPFITKEDERQFWYYLKGSDYRLGFLINFSPSRLEIKRRVYDQARKEFSA